MLCKLKAIYSTYYCKLCKNIYIYSEISMQNMKQLNILIGNLILNIIIKLISILKKKSIMQHIISKSN